MTSRQIQNFAERRDSFVSVLALGAAWLGGVTPRASVKSLQLRERKLGDATDSVCCAVYAAVMNNDNLVIAGELHIQLESGRAHLYCESVRGHCVFRCPG